MTPCRFHGFAGDVWSARRKSAENPASVEPASAVLSENFVPINIATLELRNRSVAPVRTTESRADAKATLNEIQAVASRAADAVIRNPTHEGLIDAGLKDQVLNETAHRIVDEGSDVGRFQAKATLQPSRDIVFAASLAHFECARCRDALLAGIEPQHHLAEADQVPTASLPRLDFQSH